jgi:hypothetical protein
MMTSRRPWTLVRALQEADTAHTLNAAISRALAGIYGSVTDGRLRAEFELAADLFPDADRPCTCSSTRSRSASTRGGSR